MTTHSLTSAAEQLHTSQPTVSRELAAFERKLGFRLFERRSRRLYATEQAIQLHAAVTRSYQGIHHITQVAQAILDNETFHINIACLPLFSETLLPRVCRRLVQERSDVRITFHSLDNAEMMRELMALHYELGVAEIGVAVDGMDMTECEIGDEVCIVPTGHRLAQLDVIRPADLSGESFVGFPPDDRYRRRFDQILGNAGLSKNTRIETNTAEAVCALVQQGAGVGLVNPISAWAWRGRGIEVRKFSVSIPFIAGICRPMGRPKNRLADQVTELLVDECVKFRDELAATST